MSFRVYDCLADIELSIKPTRKDADKICADKGGNDNGYYVFPVDQVKREVKINQAKSGELFDN